MRRIATLLAVFCSLAAAQEEDRVLGAMRSVVGVTARRSMTMNFQGRDVTRQMNVRQVGVVVGEDLVLTATLGEEAEDVRVFLAGSAEGIDAEVFDSDETFSILRVEDAELVPLAFASEWDPRPGQKLVWIGLVPGAVGLWTPVAKEASVDALLPVEGAERPLIYSDPPFRGPVITLSSPVLNGAGEAVGLVVPGREDAPGGRRGARAMMNAGIPVVRAASTFSQYLGGEVQERGVLGVSVEVLGDKVAEALGMKGTKGVLVTQVTPGSGAAQAGIVAQDVIVRVGDEAITSPSGLRDALRGKEAGSAVRVEVVRVAAEGPANETLDVTLGARERASKEDRVRAKRFGFVAEPLTPGVRNGQGLGEDVQGCHVRRVKEGSPAALGRPTPLHRGDVILKVGETPVPDVEALRKALADLPDGKPATFFVRHVGDTRFVEITPEK